MASVVTICNMALSHLGSQAQVASIEPPDGSVEAGRCKLYFAVCRREMLEAFDWNFALKRVKLARVENLSERWRFAYGLPSDMLRPTRVLSRAPDYGVLYPAEPTTLPGGAREMYSLRASERPSAPFTTEGDVLYTNEADAVLLYVRDVEDSTKFTPTFTTGISYLLASFLAGPVLRGQEGTAAATNLRQMAMAVAGRAAALAANSAGESQTHDHTPHWVAAR